MHFRANYRYHYVCALNRVLLFATPWTVATRAPLSMDFSRHKCGGGCHSYFTGASWSKDWIHSFHGLLPDRRILYHDATEEVLDTSYQFSQFSRSVVSDSLQPHESQHARPPCPSPTPRVYPNSCPLSQWCHPAISSSVMLFSSYHQSFSTSGSFPMSQLFTWIGQSTGVSASSF